MALSHSSRANYLVLSFTFFCRFVLLLFRHFVLHVLSFCTVSKEESHAALSHLRLKEKPATKLIAADSSNGLYLNIV